MCLPVERIGQLLLCTTLDTKHFADMHMAGVDINGRCRLLHTVADRPESSLEQDLDMREGPLHFASALRSPMVSDAATS